VAEKRAANARTVVQAPRFGKAKGRVPAKAQLLVDEAVKEIMADPMLGDPKTGPLKGVRVYKFKVGPTQFLLAYQFDDKRNVVELLDLAPHENFYKDLKDYLDAR
jgi:mRNA-degrading endonuclease RelE of RelBE toxin-antitoxin system